MPLLSQCLFLATIALLAACQQPVLTKTTPEIAAYFHPLPACDTLHVEIAAESDGPVVGDTIPNRLFFNVVPAALMQEIDYLADSSQALVLGRQYFALNDSITAYWVEIRQFWFQHHALLLYNKSRNTFTERVTLAEWYGGEGGQILTGSWLFDYDGDGQKDIVRREIQHSMTPTEGEPLERLEEGATLLLWKNGRFMETPLQDTAAVIKRYPIRTMW